MNAVVGMEAAIRAVTAAVVRKIQGRIERDGAAEILLGDSIGLNGQTFDGLGPRVSQDSFNFWKRDHLLILFLFEQEPGQGRRGAGG